MTRRPLFLLVAAAASLAAAGAGPPDALQTVLRVRGGLAASLAALGDPGAAATRELPGREERERVWAIWSRFLDGAIALEQIERGHRDFFRRPEAERPARFAPFYAAFLARHRFALEFIDRAERGGATWQRLLNQPVPELGLPAGTYDRIKFHTLNVTRRSRFHAFNVLAGRLLGDPHPLPPAALEDRDWLRRAGRSREPSLTMANAWNVVRSTGFKAWFPVQAKVSEWMGDTRVWRPGRSLISPAQIAALPARLQPGDVLLERREWYVSNVGLPGWWSHAVLYVGTREERAAFFADPAVAAWVRDEGIADGDFEALLAAREPAAAAAAHGTEGGHPVRAFEAISEGVVFTSLEHTAAADALAVLRPRLDKLAVAKALLRAFHYRGRPYDFDFDFRTDDALVCTELVYKAYEPGPGRPGLELPLGEVAGRPVIPANDLAKLFDAQAGSPTRQFDWVLFLDGRERERDALERSEAEFRASVRRPKWHIVAPAVSAKVARPR